jgi:ubiquinone/menaquinone biosynthesis C-methylase UbiE
LADTDYATLVDAHYGHRDFGTLILDTLRAAGKDIDALTPDDVAPLTHLNPRGKDATLELARMGGLMRGMQVLDVGSGLGGPALTLASEVGCQVTGLELTKEFVRVARMLTMRTGLGNEVTFHHGNALEMPFPDASFDVVWTEQFTMHIPDKVRLYAQIHRVLRPGGRLVFREVMAGPIQPLHYPVGFAKDASIVFLQPPAEIRALIVDTGFRELRWDDLSPPLQAPTQPPQGAPSREPSGLPTGPQFFQGADFEANRRNQTRNFAEGRLVVIQGVFERI